MYKPKAEFAIEMTIDGYESCSVITDADKRILEKSIAEVAGISPEAATYLDCAVPTSRRRRLASMALELITAVRVPIHEEAALSLQDQAEFIRNLTVTKLKGAVVSGNFKEALERAYEDANDDSISPRTFTVSSVIGSTVASVVIPPTITPTAGPTEGSKSESDKDDGGDIGMIIGIVVGVVVLSVLLIIAALYRNELLTGRRKVYIDSSDGDDGDDAADGDRAVIDMPSDPSRSSAGRTFPEYLEMNVPRVPADVPVTWDIEDLADHDSQGGE